MDWIESVINNDVLRLVLVAGSVCAALIGIGAFTRNAWKKLGEIVDNTRAAGELLDAQLTVNHGTSLLDKVNKIAGNHMEAERHWTVLEDAMLVSQDVAEKRWTELTEKSSTIAADLAEHRLFVAAQYVQVIGRLDAIEARLT